MEAAGNAHRRHPGGIVTEEIERAMPEGEEGRVRARSLPRWFLLLGSRIGGGAPRVPRFCDPVFPFFFYTMKR